MERKSRRIRGEDQSLWPPDGVLAKDRLERGALMDKEPPRRQPALGELAEEAVRHGRMSLNLSPQLLHERVGRDASRDPVAHGPR